MKRLIAGAAIAAATALLIAAPAQAAAAPANPVKALQKQFVTGKGVKFTERTTIIHGRTREIFVRRSGSFQFGKSGIAASEITGKFNINRSDLPEDAPELFVAMGTPEKSIRIGTTSYTSGGVFGTMIPEDKTWFKAANGPASGFTGFFAQVINVAEPKTLATILKTAKPSGNDYNGSITFGELYKVSPWLRASMPMKLTAKASKVVVTWKLELNSKSLAERLVATFPSKVLYGTSGRTSVDTRFTGWGSAVEITAPPAEEVTTELDPEAGKPEDLPLFPNG